MKLRRNIAPLLCRRNLAGHDFSKRYDERHCLGGVAYVACGEVLCRAQK